MLLLNNSSLPKTTRAVNLMSPFSENMYCSAVKGVVICPFVRRQTRNPRASTAEDEIAAHNGREKQASEKVSSAIILAGVVVMVVYLSTAFLLRALRDYRSETVQACRFAAAECVKILFQGGMRMK
ncbi:hypothetical protein MRX96_008951 [Rhipicephalus microplus]